MIEIFDNKAEIKLKNSLYHKDVLTQAVTDFSDACTIDIKKEKLTSTIVIQTKIKKELTNTAYQFCNYVLALMKNKYVELAHYVKK